MLLYPAIAGLLALGAADRAAPSERSVAAARIAVLEREQCESACPPIPPAATSDWLRSPEGQRANGCHLACSTGQPATALYRELTELAAKKELRAETPLVRLAGKDRLELARRLQSAVKDADGRSLGPLCARARESLGTRDENAFLECIGRAVRMEAQATITPPDASRALVCSVRFAERDADWLRRCPALEGNLDLDACVRGVEEAGGSRHLHSRPRSACERDAVERLANAFRGESRP